MKPLWLLLLVLGCAANGVRADPRARALQSVHPRRLQQDPDESATDYTIVKSFDASDTTQSPYLAALRAEVVKSPSASQLTSCLPGNGSANTSQACMQVLDSFAMDLGNAALSDTSATNDFCDRKSQRKQRVQILMDGPHVMMGCVLSLLHNLTRSVTGLVPSMWLVPIPSSPAGRLDECGFGIKGSNPSSAPPAPNAPATDAVATYQPEAFQGAFSLQNALQYKNGLGQDLPSWMNEQIGQKQPDTGLPVGLTYPRSQLLFVYRKDWFKTLGVSIPQTWGELLSLAASLSNLPQFKKSIGSVSGAGQVNWDLPSVTADTGPLAVTLDQMKAPGFSPNTQFERWSQSSSVSHAFHQLMYHGHHGNSTGMRRLLSAQSSVVPRRLQQVYPNTTVSDVNRLIPLCLDLAPYCKAGDLLSAIAASIIQSQGMQQGYAFNPLTLEPLTDNVGFKRAISIYRELVALAMPVDHYDGYQPTSSCQAISRPFAAGECAMTLEWDLSYSLVYNLNFTSSQARQEMAGNIGFSPLPGSGVVWNRNTDQLDACDSNLCPWGMRKDVTRYKGATSNVTISDITYNAKESTAAGALARTLNMVDMQDENQRVTINYAPYSAAFGLDAWICPSSDENATPVEVVAKAIENGISFIKDTNVISGRLLRAVFNQMVAKASELGSFATKAPGALASGGTTPKRQRRQAQEMTSSRSLLQDGQMDMMKRWDPLSPRPYALGNFYGRPNFQILQDNLSSIVVPYSNISVYDLTGYVEALWVSYFQYAANQAPQVLLTSALAGPVLQAYHEAAQYIIAARNGSTERTAAGLKSRIKDIFGLEIGGRQAISAMLWQVTGYDPPATAPASALLPSVVMKAQDSSETKLTAAIVTPCVVVVVLMLGLVAARILAKKSSQLSWKGDVLPPGTGPGTTLLMTDIQDSTTIWELVPGDVMDQAVSVHHEIIRAMALKHVGYESTTEGDSFILAFHTARSAALFAVEAQQELLLARWPPEIFKLEVCKPIWVQPAKPKSQAVKLAPDMTGPKSGTVIDFYDASQPDCISAQVGVQPPLSGGGTAFQPGHTTQAPADPTDVTVNLDAQLTQPLDDRYTYPGHWQASAADARPERVSLITAQEEHPGRVSQTGGGDTFIRGATHTQLKQTTERISSYRVLTRVVKGFKLTSVSKDTTSGNQNVTSLDEPVGPATNQLEWTALAEMMDMADWTHTCLASNGDVTPAVLHAQRNWTSWLNAHQNYTVQDHLLRYGPMAPQAGPGSILMLRGLRVRMGMASGISHSSDITLNTALGRVKYGGALAVIAKSVQDAAQGAQVLAAMSTFTQLPVEDIRDRVLVMEMGKHEVKEQTEAMQLYQLMPPSLLFRAAHLAPIRSSRQLSLGCTHAPCHQAAICFMDVVGYALLESLDSALAAKALKVYQKVSQNCLMKAGGYLVEAADGLCLASFSSPGAAARWALETIEACLEADWPEELLEHELGEVLRIPIVTAPTQHQHSPIHDFDRNSVNIASRFSSYTMGSGNRDPANTYVSPVYEAETITPGATPKFPGISELSARNSMAPEITRLMASRVLTNVKHKIVLRGLRVKCGIEYGAVRSVVHGVTARVTYRGRVMNRASRICGAAKTGQVWISQDAWNLAEMDLSADDDGSLLQTIAASKQGAFKLKGITEEMHLAHCFFCDVTQDAEPLNIPRLANRHSAVSFKSRATNGSGFLDMADIDRQS